MKDRKRRALSAGVHLEARTQRVTGRRPDRRLDHRMTSAPAHRRLVFQGRDGRSPGSRFIARTAFPVVQTSGRWQRARRSQLRGQPRLELHGEPSAFPFHLRFRRTVTKQT
ncbi:hypothetical protein KL86PLE_40373 [uncultured Pleomorphomonas sp.]|uniref:Uncharacterized protein n=1 Tax=uncultured Pleomorphomonas sp. TaxID=442121 RepID=A0A212LGF0_9HYPH|nr:hypothetical protein KL86PLE_40373 [uncultured Pleomorphomonas sp.]